jgi:outer membrane protein
MKNQIKAIAAAALFCAAGAAMAQAAGDTMVRLGGITITPRVNSSDLSPPSFRNSQSDVESASSLGGGLTYMYSDHISFDLPIALGFKHTLNGAGAGLQGVGKIGEVTALPMTLLAQYRFFEPQSALRPYVGIGPTYAYFFNETGSGALTQLTNPGGTPTTLKIDSKFTFTVQLGATVAFNNNWFIDAFYSKTPLKTTTTLSTGQTQENTLDPESFGLSIGYKF